MSAHNGTCTENRRREGCQRITARALKTDGEGMSVKNGRMKRGGRQGERIETVGKEDKGTNRVTDQPKIALLPQPSASKYASGEDFIENTGISMELSMNIGQNKIVKCTELEHAR